MLKLMFFWIIIMANCEDKCFLELFLKALSIKRKFKLYDSEKKCARYGKEDACQCSCSEFSKCNISGIHSLNAGMKKLSFYERFLDGEDSMQNFLLKSVLGFLGGILLTYLFFIFLVFSLNFTLKKATYICMVLGVILSLGLAFSVRIRCTVFLCIPQLFSKRGRQALLAYAFILALSGPAKNTLHNVEVMSESLACKQEQLRQVENELIKYVQKPNSAAKKSIEKLLEKINSAVKDFKNFILQLYRTCYDILEAVLHSQKWLYSITAQCQKKLGSPAQRCSYFLREASENCEGISSMRNWKRKCRVAEFSKQVICFSYEDNFCYSSDVPRYLSADRLQKRLASFKHRAMNMLYVRVEAHQVYSQSNRSRIHYEEVQGVATEIRQKTDQFLQYFDFMSLIFGIFILVLFMKVIIYRYKFLTDDNFDNRYITHDFVDIDKTRAEFKMETLLPLEPREKMKYIKVTSIRLVPCEKVRLMSSFIFLLFASFKIIVHMLTDSSLYWILSNIRREERLLYMSTLREEEPSITVRIEGAGLVADFVRNVTKAVKRQSTPPKLDPTPCLPDPIPPDWYRYYQILALVVICWLLALCEPYGLRLRHTVMVSYHPDRARERAIWLYNQIISDRSSFVKLARRNIRKRYKDVQQEDTLRFRFFLRKSTPKCLLCKVALTGDSDRVKCTTSECPGLFCLPCYDCLKLCSICNDPAEYDDLSGVSEEKDSSEEEEEEKEKEKEREKEEGGNSCKCSKKRKTDEKPVQKTEKLKESLEFKLKTPSFNLSSGSAKETSYGKSFIRPELLDSFPFQNSFNDSSKQKNLSELESSDWETSACSDASQRSIKKKVWSGKGDEKKGKIKKAKKLGKCEESLQNDSDSCSQKICLFKKVLDIPHPEDSRTRCEESTRNPQPDFLFKKYNEGPQGDSDANEGGTHLKARDSVEMLSRQLRTRNQESMGKKSSDGHFNVASSGSSSSSKLGDSLPIPINVKYYEIKEKRYPFIDPINIHEMSHKWSETQQEFDNDSESCLLSERSSITSHKVKIKLPGSGSTQENIRLNITEQMTSSPESDCQFYSQPCKPSVPKLKPRKKNSGLKRTAGKLNLDLKSQKFSSFYSIETDSSNERFLSVKPIRSLQRRKKKAETLDQESRDILKLVAGKWAKQPKRVDYIKAKLARLFKKKPDRKSLGEDGISDVDDVENLLKKAVFLSDEEFEQISRALKGKSTQEDKKNFLASERISALLASRSKGSK